MKKKKIVVSIIVIGLLLSTASLTTGLKKDKTIIYVDDDAPSEWYDETHVRTIQEGINNASPGYTVFVFNGTYYGNVVIDKSITLRGEDRDNTIIDGAESFGIINVSADSTIITGFTIQNDSGTYDEELEPSCGITIESYRHDVIIKGNIVNDTVCGILVDEYSYDNIVSKNNIYNSTNSGMSVYFSHDNIVTENIIVHNNLTGLHLADSWFNTVFNNTIINHVWGMQVRGSWADNNIICGNIIAENEVGINVWTGSDHNNIYGNTITNNVDGMWVWMFCDFNEIYENTFEDNTNYSIIMGRSLYCTYNSVYHNNFINNGKPPMCLALETDWDNGYPSGGNYWSDYNGTDNYHGPNQSIPGNDGVGDTPYSGMSGLGQDNYPLTSPYGWINEPPNAPIIDGLASGKAGVEYNYTFVTVDPEEYGIYYWIDWGDGNNTSWIGPYISGEMITVSHTWTEQGKYTISAKAKDTRGAESEWGYLEVTMPKNQPSSQQSQSSSSGQSSSQPSSQQSTTASGSQILQSVGKTTNR